MLWPGTGNQNREGIEPGGTMAQDDADIRRQLLAVLMRKVADDHYPSVTMLDMIEQLVTPEEEQEYTSLLLEKVQVDNFPSIDLLRRVHGFC
jgi:hypothetical protein